MYPFCYTALRKNDEEPVLPAKEEKAVYLYTWSEIHLCLIMTRDTFHGVLNGWTEQGHTPWVDHESAARRGDGWR